MKIEIIGYEFVNLGKDDGIRSRRALTLTKLSKTLRVITVSFDNAAKLYRPDARNNIRRTNKMALFESYERRIDKINGVLAEYGIASVEECRDNLRRARL